MPKKEYSSDGKTCKVTFEVSAEAGANKAYLCGEFNDWDQTCTPMAIQKDGSFNTTIELKAGRSYRYRFIVDGQSWVNDWFADDYAMNPFGGEDCVVEV
ncbi:MAG: isoamylase early set domain-containing protein [Trueperaceae bacterium]|nr:MAG: isoamylase early set domain-containing protein [Trueperaceae bacterium]